jgi:hypothetical protein
MCCDACEMMHLSATPKPHAGLSATGKPNRLRPLGHRPILVVHYTCCRCGTNWLREADSHDARESEWICLLHSASIFDPGGAFELTTGPSSVAAVVYPAAVTDRPAARVALFPRFE